jgi:hypothetical protein
MDDRLFWQSSLISSFVAPLDFRVVPQIQDRLLVLDGEGLTRLKFRSGVYQSYTPLREGQGEIGSSTHVRSYTRGVKAEMSRWKGGKEKKLTLFSVATRISHESMTSDYIGQSRPCRIVSRSFLGRRGEVYGNKREHEPTMLRIPLMMFEKTS